MVVLLFLSFRLLEVHTEMFTGGIISCLELRIRLPQRRKRWAGRRVGREGGQGGRKVGDVPLFSFCIFSDLSVMKEQ